MTPDRKPGALYPGWPGDEDFKFGLDERVRIRNVKTDHSEVRYEEPERVVKHGGTEGRITSRHWSEVGRNRFLASYEVARLSDGVSMGFFALADLVAVPPLQQLAEAAE